MSKTKDRMRENNLRYKQNLGQNFIYDDRVLESLAEAAEISPEEDVLEIGPGAGSLTGKLCDRAHSVLAVELDERLIPLLQAFLAEKKNFNLIQGDIMTLNLEEATVNLRKPYAVVANIPYYITTPLIIRLLEAGKNISRMCLMVQKEVAEKILSAPGKDGWGPMAIRCQYYCEPSLALSVPAECFTPPPKVDSAFIRLQRRTVPPVKVRDENQFFHVVGAAFALRRKTMLNNLCATFRVDRSIALDWLQAAGLNEKTRGEKMSMAELARLSDAMTP
ncbi:MAG: 16S rRNA (adenine(1518)-N(6)/adenine(1519)-N(6))-dimethyltransferase RsmA [Clostridia bacterium]|nr:16S rRNA (adenine(1518)-N(6)/adenine(1519)-N(6))-dimethyltransferase RsmA [Clostridia bacterium]